MQGRRSVELSEVGDEVLGGLEGFSQRFLMIWSARGTGNESVPDLQIR